MSIYDTQGLPEWLAVLKAAGVRHYKDDDLDVEFFPPIQEPDLPDALPEALESARETARRYKPEARVGVTGADLPMALEEPGPPACVCGHLVTEHNVMGYCIHACDPMKCEAEETPAP